MTENEQLRDEFFSAAGARRVESHTLPNGKIVYVEEISAEEWAQIESESRRAMLKNDGKPDTLIDARLLVRCVTDGKGGMLFAHHDEELRRIMKLPHHFLDPLLKRANAINFADARSWELLKKTSVTANSDSSTNSQEIPAT